LATLILNGSQGTTFEQMVNDLEASKSTICTHLNALEGQQKISYFTKCGDRKRYYLMAPGYVSRKIDSQLSQWQKEQVLQEQILLYKNNYNKLFPDIPLTTTIHEDVLTFLSQSIQFLEQLSPKFQNKEIKLNTEIL
jgi:DNA-binding transcriptional regulator GbsR (MarR family)